MGGPFGLKLMLVTSSAGARAPWIDMDQRHVGCHARDSGVGGCVVFSRGTGPLKPGASA